MSETAALNPDLQCLLEFCNMDRKWERGAGSYLYDDTGRSFLDCYCQYGAVSLGHNHKSLVDALKLAIKQMQPALVQPFRAPNAVALAEKLAELTPGELSHCVFTTSGAETVEAALKLVSLKTERPIILSCEGSYHGKTLGAMSASGAGAYGEMYGTDQVRFHKIAFGNADALEDFLTRHVNQVAAFLLEPIQGERGVYVPPDGYLSRVRELCSEHNVALVLDEIQTGIGRTGTLFCCEQENVEPDLLLTSKALGGGLFPLGACLVKEEFWDSRFALSHSSTFANNNLACVVADTVLTTVTAPGFLEDINIKSEILIRGLHRLAAEYPDIIHEVRGRGLLCAIQLNSDLSQEGLVLSYLHNQGILAYSFAATLAERESILVLPTLGNVNILRIMPPLIISEEEIERVIEGIANTCRELRANATKTLVLGIGKLGSDEPDDVYPQKPVILPPVHYHIDDDDEEVSRFAFIMHYTQEEDVITTDPNLRKLSKKELVRFCEYIANAPPGLVYETKTIQSLTGKRVKGFLIASGMLPKEMYKRGRKQVGEHIYQGVHLAASLGAQVVGLGAFTSIFGSRTKGLLECGAVVTTGNALTSSMSFEVIKRVAEQKGQPLSKSRICVVGARGAVGILCAQLLARENPISILLIGNSASGTRHLETLKELLLKYTDCTISVSTDIQESGSCDVILSATSSQSFVLDDVDLKRGAIVCDVARPQDAGPKTRARKDLYVMDGGLVALPDPTLNFGVGNIQGFPDGIQLACLSETMLLALAGHTRHLGVGNEISIDDVDYVTGLAKLHGFKPYSPLLHLSGELESNNSRSLDFQTVAMET